MNTTRHTVNIARFAAILSMIATYLLVGLFFEVLLDSLNPFWLCTVLGLCSAAWVFDTYHRMYADFIIRMAVLGSGYGFAAAGIAVFAAGYLF